MFHTLTISDIRRETPDSVAISFDVPEELREAFAYKPGQYLTLRAEVNGEDIRRSYSIASAPGTALTVGVKRVADGAFSTFAQALEKGGELAVMPPEGRFICHEESNIVLIAAGSGITPMVAIAADALARGAKVTLVYGNRQTGSIMFRDALDSLKDRYLDRFTLVHILSREAQDELAASSHQKLAAAYDAGFLDDQITPFRGLERDSNLRPDSSVEKLSKLKPVFGKGEAATMTAANSTPLTDGASVVLLASEEWAKERGLPILAYITEYETAAVDYVHGGEGLLMAPAYAMARMLTRAGLSLQDFDYYEIHEAFASQVLATLAAWEDPVFCKERLGLDAPLGSIDRAKLNVNGSSLAAGHPFAATGGRILPVLAKLLAQKGSGKGVISVCAAGGQGVTAILERP